MSNSQTIAYTDDSQKQAEYLIALANQAGVPHFSLVRKRGGWFVPQAVADLYDATQIDGFLGDGGVKVVYAGTNLSTPRPDASCVYWRFSAGVNTGTNGSAITHGRKGDLVFVAGA